MTDRERKAAARRGFLKGFAGTLAVLLPIYACVFFVHLQSLERRAVESASPPAQSVPVETARSVNLLVLLEQQATGRLYAASLLRLDADNGRVVFAALPPTTVVLDGQLPRTLGEVHSQKGALGTRAAVCDTLGVPLEGYLCLDEGTLDGLLACFAPVPFTMDAPVQVMDAQGRTVYSKGAGSGYLSGNDIAHLLLYGGYEGDERTALEERMAKACFAAFAGERFSDNIASAYAAFVDRMDTDLSTADIYVVGRAAFAAAGDTAAVHTLRVGGAYGAEGRFELAEGSDTDLQTLFGRGG